MKDNNIFYKIKELEKNLIRKLTMNCNNKNSSTPTQMMIIGYLLTNNDKDVYQKDLEDILNLRRSTISDVLKRMESKDLIKRVTSEYDIRSKKIILSESAKEYFDKKSIEVNNIEIDITKDIDKNDLKVFNKVLDKMIDNLSKK